MTRYALLALALLVAAPSAAKDPCSRVKVEEDKFTGGESATGVIQRLNQYRMLGMFMQYKSGQPSLTVTVKEGGALSGVVAAGTEVAFSFEDGRILSLATARDAALQSYVSSSAAIMTNVPYTFTLTAEQLQVFSTTPLEAMRVPVISQGTTYDWSANKGVKKKLQAVATCMAGM